MAFWILDQWDGGTLDYVTLGFIAEENDILEASAAPDPRWSSTGSGPETVTRYTVGSDPSYVEPADGHVLTWSDVDNAYVPTAPAASSGLINARDYGAVGDFVADDTVALQAALDAAEGGMCWLPEGTYLISAALTIPDRTFLVGAGPHATAIKLANGSNTDMVKSVDFDTLTGTNESTPPSFVGLIDLRLDGNKANNTSGIGLQTYVRSLFIDRLIITECADDGLYTEGPSSGAGVSSWTNLPPGQVRWLTCVKNGGNGWTHKGHSDMQVGYYQAIINDGHGLYMQTVPGTTRSTMYADHLRISSNGAAIGSRGVYLTGNGTDLMCAVGRFENNGGAGIYAEADTKIRVGVCQVLQNCKVADSYQVDLTSAHRSSFGDLTVIEPYLSSTGGVRVSNSTRVRLRGHIDGTPDPNGPSAGASNTGYGLALVGSGCADGVYEVDIRDHNGAGGAGVRTGDSSGIVRNRIRASIQNCTTAWWCTNAGVGNLYDITAHVAVGQSTVAGAASGSAGTAGDARVFGNDGSSQVYP